MVTVVPSNAMPPSTAFSRSPFGSAASTMVVDRDVLRVILGEAFPYLPAQLADDRRVVVVRVGDRHRAHGGRHRPPPVVPIIAPDTAACRRLHGSQRPALRAAGKRSSPPSM